MFWIALAAQVSAPEPVQFNKWFSVEDVPEFLLRTPGVRFAGVRATVKPDGTLQSCAIEYSSKLAALDQYTCKLFAKRAKYLPARAADGQHMYGVDRFPFAWVVAADAAQARRPADLEVEVAALPGGLKSPVYVPVTFATDVTGKPSACTADGRRVGEGDSVAPALVSAACSQFEKLYKATPAKDALGAPIASIQNGLVRFTVGP